MNNTDGIDELVEWQMSNQPPTHYACPGCRTSSTVPTLVCDCGWSADE